MRPDIEIFATAAELSAALAARVATSAAAAIAARGRFLLAIPGGSVVPLLARGLDNVDASQWHVFWTDERCVPPEDPRSNFHLAQTELLPRLRLPRANIHPVAGALGPEAAARAYEQDLGGFSRFDLVLLGLGEDGHVASLFPGNPALLATRRLVAPVRNAPKPPPDRITLTLTVLNQARQVRVVASGAGKANILARVLAPGAGQPKLPAQRLRPVDGDLVWLLDHAAATGLPQPLSPPAPILESHP